MRKMAVSPSRCFKKHLQATHRAGLMNAVSMDTAYVNLLSQRERCEVLGWAREALGKESFVAAAFIESQEGDVVSLYRRQMDAISAHGAIPIIFQTVRLHGQADQKKIAIYQEICAGYPHVLGFELIPDSRLTERFSTRRSFVA